MPSRRFVHRVRQMNDVERAWVGAMIDGEGYLEHRGHGFMLTVGNTNLEIISALLRATGVGTVRKHPEVRGAIRRVCWAWRIATHADTEEIARQCSIYSQKCQEVFS